MAVEAGLFCPLPGFPPNVWASCRTLGRPLKALSWVVAKGPCIWEEAATEGCEEACVSEEEGGVEEALTGCEEAGEGVIRTWDRLRALGSSWPINPAPTTGAWGWRLREEREEEEATPEA